MTEQELKLLNHNKGGNNYILKGNASNHWCAFGASILSKLIDKYGEEFNIVVYWTEKKSSHVSYVCIPYSDIKHLFSKEHITPSQNRWDFIIKHDLICVHANMNFAISIKPYLNIPFEEFKTETTDKDFYEGSPKMQLHLSKERNHELTRQFKNKRFLHDPNLHCEICGFSFYKNYGDIGYKYIEAHHIKPISELTEETKTSFQDLILVCSNCHSMLHTSTPPLLPQELKKLLKY